MKAVSFFLLCLAAVASAAPEPLDTMNGYKLKQFEGFEQKWRLVTVRYRKDTGEMRLTYANDVAWKTLSEGRTDYPKGAVFAKIGVQTEPDPAFTTSLSPDGARRYQFMVRDEQKHKDTFGWGYALFSKEGKRFPEDTLVQSRACAACHQIVGDRGQIFSSPMNISDDFKKVKLSQRNFVDFEELSVSKLPVEVRETLPPGTTRVRSVVGRLRTRLFQGTLDEIRPALTKEVIRTQLVALLMDEEGKRFSTVMPEKTKDCGYGSHGYRAVHNFRPKVEGSPPAETTSAKLYTVSFCP